MEKIKKLIQLFNKEKIDGYIIPKNDECFSEYTPFYNDRLNYISNFSGSYGFALVLKSKNYLFVDGRYTLQAKKQSGKCYNIITIPSKMPCDILKNKKLIIGFDPKLFTKKTLNIFTNKNKSKFKQVEDNLIDKIWRRKKRKNLKKFYSLPNNSVGSYYKSKINKIASYLKKTGADFQFISSSENNAWLLNIRGEDTNYSPIPFCYILIDKKKNVKLFCDLKKISFSLRRYLNKISLISIKNTSSILSQINKKKFIIDSNSCSIYFENIIFKKNFRVNVQDPIYNLKAIKNENEIRNIKAVHILDGAALTKYLFWVKKNFNKRLITEISGSQKLLEYKKQSQNFKSLSFPTISGSGPNGAIIHYKATKKTNRILRKGDIYLVDSGGQYKFGTTDVTRTISLKNSNSRIKEIFTRILKGHIAVADYNLKFNTTGSAIDKSARKFLKEINLDYSHGTGHGVGYFLNVHEGPQAISKKNNINFKKGMVVSNEPGYYQKNKFGIRIENLIYVKRKKGANSFENLTMVPIDKDLINSKLLSPKERNWLNNYHRKVFLNLNKFMDKSEILELKKACSAI